MIQRQLYNIIQQKLFKNKIIVIVGARQTGKSTLLKNIAKFTERPFLFLDCDDPDVKNMLQNQSTSFLLRLVKNKEIVFIDEAQRVENIGLTLKQIHDNTENCQLIVSGSSALELSNKINEPLTGRKFEYVLYPLAFNELVEHTNIVEEIKMLQTRLVYGYYPDIINNLGNETEILKNLVTSYLYKDIFTFQDIRKPQIIEKLLQNLAFQVASEVNYNELSQNLGINSITIERYIDLLEKNYIIFRLYSFSRNIRNELKKSRKIYFYDNGVRNMIISNFNPIDLRQDKGQLWENYLVSERAKFLAYNNIYCNRYFWRTTQQQEIDYIEERSGKIFAYEMKWNKSNSKLSKTFSNAYPNTQFEIINKENFFNFLTI
jgi:predicted AAA+ superfamily ATPase